LIPINAEAKKIALSHVDPSASTMEKARSLYEHTNANMTYDKSGTGWGRGDFQYACDARTGNCTDFHSYFIGLCRNMGIPAYFEIGYAIPKEEREGKIPGYHCWAYFQEGNRWIPVDISEGDKHPELKEYFFGHLDVNRIALTRGRDIILSPPQEAEPLNYFVFPYAEVDGQEHANVDTQLTFAETSEL
jgi:transglutaminase-like putative cysteine protease